MPNSSYALVGGLGNHLRMYDIKSGANKKKYSGHVNNTLPLVHSTGKVGDEHYIFGASESDELKVWNVTSEILEHSVKLPKSLPDDTHNFAACVDYHEASRRLAVCGPNARNAAYVYQVPFN